MSQRVYFCEKFLPVAEVAQLWLDNGWSRDEIFVELGFRLGFSDFNQPSIDEYTPEALAAVCVKYMAPRLEVAA